MSTNLTYENFEAISQRDGYDSDELALKQNYNGNISLNFPQANKALIIGGLLALAIVTGYMSYLNYRINKMDSQDKNKNIPNTPVNYPNGYYTYNPNGYYAQRNPYENPVDPNTYLKK